MRKPLICFMKEAKGIEGYNFELKMFQRKFKEPFSPSVPPMLLVLIWPWFHYTQQLITLARANLFANHVLLSNDKCFHCDSRFAHFMHDFLAEMLLL